MPGACSSSSWNVSFSLLESGILFQPLSLIFQDADTGKTLVSFSLWCSSILYYFDFLPSHDLG